MKWEASGADRATGEERRLVIEADDEASARRRANRAGVMVADVRPLDPDDSVAGSPVVRTGPLQVIARPVTMPTPPPTQYAMPVHYAPAAMYVAQPAPPGVQTIQKTAKIWKAQMALGVLLMIAGVVMLMVGFQGGPVISAMLGTLAVMVGFVWYLFARVMAWWHHG